MKYKIISIISQWNMTVLGPNIWKDVKFQVHPCSACQLDGLYLPLMQKLTECWGHHEDDYKIRSANVNPFIHFLYLTSFVKWSLFCKEAAVKAATKQFKDYKNTHPFNICSSKGIGEDRSDWRLERKNPVGTWTHNLLAVRIQCDKLHQCAASQTE